MNETPVLRPSTITPKHLALMLIAYEAELRSADTIPAELRAQLVRDFGSALMEQNRIVTRVTLGELADKVAQLLNDPNLCIA